MMQNTRVAKSNMHSEEITASFIPQPVLLADSTTSINGCSTSSRTDTDDLCSKPKRPLSGYNMFFRDQRELLLKVIPSRNHTGTGHGKIGFQDLAKVIGAKWKQIAPEEKERYESIAAVRRQEYLHRMKEWKKTQKKNRKTMAVMKAKNTIKRKVSSRSVLSQPREQSPTISAHANSTFHSVVLFPAAANMPSPLASAMCHAPVSHNPTACDAQRLEKSTVCPFDGSLSHKNQPIKPLSSEEVLLESRASMPRGVPMTVGSQTSAEPSSAEPQPRLVVTPFHHVWYRPEEDLLNKTINFDPFEPFDVTVAGNNPTGPFDLDIPDADLLINLLHGEP